MFCDSRQAETESSNPQMFTSSVSVVQLLSQTDDFHLHADNNAVNNNAIITCEKANTTAGPLSSPCEST